MKHIFTLSLLLIGLVSLGQVYDVTFTVNMANETTSPDGVYLAGGGMFGLPGDNLMNDDDGDDVWEITMAVDAGSPDYEPHYTFLNGNCPAWDCKENLAGLPCGDPGNFNDRTLPALTGDVTLMHCFGQCTTDGSCEDAGQPIDVTFRVNMADVTTAAAVYVTGGSIDGWCGTCQPMTDDDGDDVWEITLTMDPGGHEYKFTNGGWDDGEILDPVEDESCTLTTGDFTNRFITVAGSDPMVLDVMCFNSCDDCDGTGGGDEADVTFKVDMNEQTIQGPIYVTGNTVDNWCGTCVEMLDGDADGVYEVTLPLGMGFHEYKFNNGGWDFSEALDSIADAACTLTTDVFTNRIIEVTSTDAVVLDAVCFESCDECLVDAIAENDAAQFELYPTVTGESVRINFADVQAQSRVLTIHNTAMQVVEKRTVSNGLSQLILDVSDYSTGLYIVNLEVDGMRHVERLIVTK